MERVYCSADGGFIDLSELEELSEDEQLQDDVYYMYPSHMSSTVLVMKGCYLKKWFREEFFNDYMLIAYSLRDTFEVLLKAFPVSVIRDCLQSWAQMEDVSADAIVATAFVLLGLPIKRIKYGSDLHRKLNQIVGD